MSTNKYDEKGNPTAAILPIKDYKKIPSILEEIEDHKETIILSKSPEFKKLVKRGLEDIRAGRIKPWKEIWGNRDLSPGSRVNLKTNNEQGISNVEGRGKEHGAGSKGESRRSEGRGQRSAKNQRARSLA